MEVNVKKISLDLTGIDGNAYSLLGAFQRQAKKEKWSPQEISDVVSKAMLGDYDQLVATLAEHCE